jgi:hypothetical protein
VASLGSSGGGSETNMSRGSLASAMMHSVGLLPGAAGGASSSSLSDSTPRSRQSSALQRLRAGISPANIKRALTRESSLDLLSPRLGSEARGSVATGASDLQTVLSMTGQVHGVCE